ncbi:MAG: type VI secretion system Vgr family protein [Sandaracinaceae bacterium]
MSGDSDDHEDSPAETIGEVGEGAKNLLGGIADAIPESEEGDAEDAREGLETASEVAETAAQGAQSLNSLQRGIQSGNANDIGAGVGSATDALRHVVPDSEVNEVLGGVGQAARGLGRLVQTARGVIDGIAAAAQEAHNVHYHLTVAGADNVRWRVRSVHLEDAIGGLPIGVVEATVDTHTFVDETELFGKDAELIVEREDRRRHFRGLIHRARIEHGREEQHVRVEITPAAWMLSQTRDSRVYQDLTVPDLVEQLVRELLGNRSRSVRRETTENYLPHEYLVQHRESHFNFISRLCDEEGIWFCFDHEADGQDHEVLVLCDSNSNRPRISGGDHGRVELSDRPAISGDEIALHVHRQRSMGPTDAVFTSHDWTNPTVNVRSDQTGRGEWSGPPLEHHEHHHSVRFHEYDEGGGQYRSNTVERHARMHAERLDLTRARWRVDTTVIDARPGHVFELSHADDLDGNYLIVGVSASGHPDAHGGGWHSVLDVIPADVPYRPPAPARPVMPGPETATVVGPAGEEIHTDQYGRIKVQFHWDRRGERNEYSSTWIRVAHSWAGTGFGTIFIPRIGMEVVVSFLGGDPDRPLVTGCIYNGDHPVPYTLPEHKTRSTIKTNSSLGGGGYNELRFEDKAGSEEVWIHAQKDFNEVVEHCHTTHVKVDQTNNVDHDQSETIGNDQTLHVENNRTKTVDVDESNTVTGNRTTEVGPNGGDDSLKVHNNRFAQIENGNDGLWILRGNRQTTITQGRYDVEVKGRFQIIQHPATPTHFELRESAYLSTPGRVQIKSGDGATHYDASASGRLQVETRENTEIKSHDQILGEATNHIKLNAHQKIMLTAETEIKLEVGSSKIVIKPSGIEIQGASIKVNATGGDAEINASGQVKIKC